MPGTFAHIALVNRLCVRARLEEIELNTEIKHALLVSKKFCELGAVSPDYPYLSLLNNEAEGWANVMHYWKTADFVRVGVRHLLSECPDFNAPDAQKRIAWLFGFASHLVADLTVHPVIELRVGPYEANATEHRRCEMHQDAYIFQQTFRQEIGSLEYLHRAGLETCGRKTGDTHHLHTSISRLWTQILGAYALSEVALKSNLPKPQHPPGVDDWHHHYVALMECLSQDGRWLFLARGVADAEGLIYPRSDEINRTYIENLKTPTEPAAHYDGVFQRAERNVMETWRELGAALAGSDPQLFTLANADLDTGIADGAVRGTAKVFWSS